MYVAGIVNIVPCYPRRACTARVWLVGLSVCLSVTQHLTSPMFFRLTNDTTYLTGNEAQKFCGDFPETTAFERYAVKTSEKANIHNLTGLTATWSARSVYFGAQEVTTNGMYQLPHAIYYCR